VVERDRIHFNITTISLY